MAAPAERQPNKNDMFAGIIFVQIRRRFKSAIYYFNWAGIRWIYATKYLSYSWRLVVSCHTAIFTHVCISREESRAPKAPLWKWVQFCDLVAENYCILKYPCQVFSRIGAVWIWLTSNIALSHIYEDMRRVQPCKSFMKCAERVTILRGCPD